MHRPVVIASGYFNIQLGMTKPENMEKPKMKMFRDEFISAYWGGEGGIVSNVHAIFG